MYLERISEFKRRKAHELYRRGQRLMTGLEYLISPESISGIFQIILIDIVLGGDNAIVIAMAAGKLPHRHQKMAILLGTAGAVGARFILAAVMVWLLRIPYLHVAGAIVLIGIGVRLLRQKKKKGHSEAAVGGGLPGAVMTIIIADAVMSMDNVIAIVGVAQENMLMIILGMCISVPIIVCGSTFFIELIKKFPVIIYAGGAILGWAAGDMIIHDPALAILLPYKMAAGILGMAMTLVPAILLDGWQSHVQRIMRKQL